MKKAGRAAGILIIAGAIAAFAILEIDAARNLDMVIDDSTLLSRDDNTSLYDVSLQLTNQRFILLSAGQIEYTITVNGEALGTGTINPFYLGPYDGATVGSEFRAHNDVLDKYENTLHRQHVDLDASSTYKLYALSFEVPFGYTPTVEQVDKFVVQ